MSKSSGIYILLSCFMAFTIISCKKKTTTRTLGNPNPIGPETPGTDFGDEDACAFPLALTQKVKVDPNKLKVDDIRFISAGDAYAVVVNEPTSAPAADLIAYEVCYQDQEQDKACKTYFLETYLDLRNSQLEAGTAKVTTFACCNETDGRCEGTKGPKRRFGASRAERDYYCSEDDHGFIQIQPKTSSLQSSSGSEQQNLYLIELENRLERAALAAFNIIDELGEGPNKPQANLQLTSGQTLKENPAFRQLKNDGFESYLVELRTNGLEYAQSIIQYEKKGPKNQDSGLQLTNSEGACLPDDDFIYDPIDNPYDDDPGNYTPPKNPLDDDEGGEGEGETDEAATDSEETDNSEELQDLCQTRGREYADLECGEVKWLFDSKECMVYPKADEPYVIDPLLEPQFTSCVVAPSNSEKSEGKFWKVTGGLSIAVGAVALTGGVASTGYNKYKKMKLDADNKALHDERNRFDEFFDDQGNLDEKKFNSADVDESVRKRYYDYLKLSNEFDIKSSKSQQKTDTFVVDGLADADPDSNVKAVAQAKIKLDDATEKLNGLQEGDPQKQTVNEEVGKAQKEFDDVKQGSKLTDQVIDSEVNRQRYFSDLGLSADNTVEDAKKLLVEKEVVLNELEENVKKGEFNKAQKMLETLEAGEKHKFNGVVELGNDDLKRIFPSGSPVVTSSTLLSTADPSTPPSKRNRIFQNVSKNLDKIGKNDLLRKRSLRWGGAAFAFGILATTLFSLAQDRVASLIARLAEIENYIIDTLLQIDACEKDASKCFDPATKK